MVHEFETVRNVAEVIKEVVSFMGGWIVCMPI
jgi:hypothetical protein